jgi:hypothetical protein
MAIDTNIITSVAIHATQDTAPPTLPAYGSVMDWSTAPDGWVQVEFQFAADAFAFAQVDRKRIEIWPPALPSKTGVIEKPPAIASCKFVSYEVGEKLYQYCTNMAEVNGVFTPLSAHASYKAIFLEIGGVGGIYLPMVTLEAELPTGAVWDLSTQAGNIEVFYSAVKGTTYQWHQYQP